MRRFAKPNLKRNAAASVIAAKMVGKRRLRWTDLSCCKISDSLSECIGLLSSFNLSQSKDLTNKRACRQACAYAVRVAYRKSARPSRWV